MNNLDKQYQALLQDIIDNGFQKGDRTGTGTISVFGRQIRHKMSDGFPLITTKKMYWKGIVTELIWFLQGDTNIKYLVDNDCHIWDGDAYQSYCKRYWQLDERDKIEYGSSYYNHETDEYEFETYSKEEFINKIKTDDEFAKKWGDLGKIYGYQWRSWEMDDTYLGDGHKMYFDQIANLITDLKTNPDSRRLMVTAWNPADLPNQVLPPCHYGFQVYTRELSLEERMNEFLKLGMSPSEFRKGDNYGTVIPKERTLEVFDTNNIPTRAISLMWNQRSVDTFLGLPFNIASYGLLLEIVGKMVNMIPEELIGNLGDTHLYSNHIEQAKEQIGEFYTPTERNKLLKNAMGEEKYQIAVSEQVPFGGGLSEYYESYNIPKHNRESYSLPKLGFNKSSGFFKELGDDLTLLGHLETSDFMIENYKSHPTIKAPLSN